MTAHNCRFPVMTISNHMKAFDNYLHTCRFPTGNASAS